MLNKLVTVRTFDTPIKANMALSFLETEGVEGFLEGEETVGMAWHLGNAFGGVKLQVREEDAERASILLDSDRLDEAEDLDWSQVDTGDKSYFEEREDDESQDETESGKNENEIVDRAFRSMVFGLLFIPILFYSLYLMGTVDWSSKNLTQKNKDRIPLIMLIDIGAITAYLYAFINYC